LAGDSQSRGSVESRSDVVKVRREKTRIVVERGRRRFVTQQARDGDDRRTFLDGQRRGGIAQIVGSDF
jgi:hypothetical protein